MNTPKTNEQNKKKVFWKRSSSKLPGSSMQSPPMQLKDTPQHAPRHKLTFKEFEDHTQDAWDATDDDLLRAALAKLELGSSPDQVKAAAQAVIDQHSKGNDISPVVKLVTSSHIKKVENKKQSSDVESSTLTSSNFSANQKSSEMHTNSFSPLAKKVPGGASRTISKTETPQHISMPVASPTTGDSEKLKPVNGHAVANSNEASIAAKQPLGDNDKSSVKKMVLSPPSVAGAGSAPKSQSIRMPMSASKLAKEKSRIEKFYQIIESDSIDLGNLRTLSWPGIPTKIRAVTWKLLSGYLPTNKDRRDTVLTRKRKEYFTFVEQYYEARDQPMYQATFHQIHIDIPRTNPLIPLFQQQVVQTIFERLLFVWAVRHPASGYVQGINDLVTPFFVVFLSEELDEECEVETYEVSDLSEDTLRDIEADTYWCLNNLLDGIQDNYTFAQPGVQTKVNKLRELTKRVDAELHAHLEKEQIEYLQFSFRWMNNLLMREIPLRCTIRLWDTYLAENDGFSDFHLYVCAAFLTQWRKQLLSEKDFQGLMLMIQNVPTHHWGDEEIKLLLAEAYKLKYTFADAPSHLPSKR